MNKKCWFHKNERKKRETLTFLHLVNLKSKQQTQRFLSI
jgi:hypothetical protein